VHHWIRIDYGRLDPDPGGQKLPTLTGKKVMKLQILRAESFSFSLDGLRLGIGEIAIFSSKNCTFSCKILQILVVHSKPWIRDRIRIDQKCWIRTSIENSADPHCRV
jgi:hypothetical protein